MTGSTGHWGEKLVRGGVAALLSFFLVQPLAFADQQEDDDEPVGWPYRASDKAQTTRELRRSKPATPLPKRSDVTDKALAAWSIVAGKANVSNAPAQVDAPLLLGAMDSAPLATTSAAAAPARIASPEIAPLKRLIPPVRHQLIVYAPGDFSISTGTAQRLGQMAMRLRGTRDRISIIAHSASGPASGPGSRAAVPSGAAQISTHEAVKLSFKRAMLVRLYLIEEGVSPDQIDLEALPQAEDDGPPDRVEIAPTANVARR